MSQINSTHLLLKGTMVFALVTTQYSVDIFLEVFGKSEVYNLWDMSTSLGS